MARVLTSEINGEGVERILIVSKEVITPDQFASACKEIVARLSGDAAHRALDSLVTHLLSSLGYGEGMAIFLAAVAAYHQPESAAQVAEITRLARSAQ